MIDDTFRDFWRTVKFYRPKSPGQQRKLLANFILAKARASTKAKVKVRWLQFLKIEREKHASQEDSDSRSLA